jgi:ketosteroid isomerase-like protein
MEKHTESGEGAEEVARQVRTALEAAELTAFSDLLHPDVRWGPPDDPTPPCRNREQVLAWYRRGQESGARARVSEVVVVGDRILVGLVVRGTGAARERGGQATRWQVLTVRAGQVVDIVGYDQRSEAVARARSPTG